MFSTTESFVALLLRFRVIFNRRTKYGILIAFLTGLVYSRIRTVIRRKKLSKLRHDKRTECKQALHQLQNMLKDDKMLTPSRQNEIINLTLGELIVKLQAKSVTAMEALKAYQIEALKVHSLSNCLIEPFHEAEQWALDCDMSGSIKGPLHGVPVSIKDCYGVQGYDCTIGCANWIGKPWASDSVMIKLLKSLGAVPFVKTNVPQVMISYETCNPIFGATVNPQDPKRGVGGSSGGEAALLALKGSVLGFGTDLGGSLRIPAHMAGICALKPTCQRFGNRGLHPLLKGQTCVMGSSGPMTRDVSSLVIAMETLCSSELYNLDPTLPPVMFNKDMLNATSTLRIGYYVHDGVTNSLPACQRAVMVAVDQLSKLGHELVPWQPPTIVKHLHRLYISSLFGDGGMEFSQILKDDNLDASSRALYILSTILGPKMKTFLSFLLGPLLPFASVALNYCKGFSTVSGWWKHTREINEFRELFLENWKSSNLDVVICPGFPILPLPLGQAAAVNTVVSYTALFNLLDFPAGSMPVTRVTKEDIEQAQNEYMPENLSEKLVKASVEGTKGMSVNVQVVGLPWREEMCLNIMRQLENAIER